MLLALGIDREESFKMLTRREPIERYESFGPKTRSKVESEFLLS